MTFFKKELHYLGHLLTRDGIKPQPAKVEALTNLKPPTSAKGVREFLEWLGTIGSLLVGLQMQLDP